MQMYADFLCIFIDCYLSYLLTSEGVSAITTEDDDDVG